MAFLQAGRFILIAIVSVVCGKLTHPLMMARINTDGMQYETGSGFWHKSSYRIMRERVRLKQEINLYKRNQECLEKNNSFMYVQFIVSKN
uniref:Uncharacterized protein n=1 Tax=Glossina palpalis gambiensis TaxID=67801 RepID=A0A1B0BEU2_9MUSC